MFLVSILEDWEGYWHLCGLLLKLSIRNGYQPSKYDVQHKYRLHIKFIEIIVLIHGSQDLQLILELLHLFGFFSTNIYFRFGTFSYFILKHWNNCLSNEIHYYGYKYCETMFSSKMNDSIAVNRQLLFSYRFFCIKESNMTLEISPLSFIRISSSCDCTIEMFRLRKKTQFQSVGTGHWAYLIFITNT